MSSDKGIEKVKKGRGKAEITATEAPDDKAHDIEEIVQRVVRAEIHLLCAKINLLRVNMTRLLGEKVNALEKGMVELKRENSQLRETMGT